MIFDLTTFDEEIMERNVKWGGIATILYLTTWIYGINSSTFLAINFITTWYLSCLIISNYYSPFAVQTVWIYSLFVLVDSIHLSTYLFINNYVWTDGAFVWCLIPRIVWCVGLRVLIKD